MLYFSTVKIEGRNRTFEKVKKLILWHKNVNRYFLKNNLAMSKFKIFVNEHNFFYWFVEPETYQVTSSLEQPSLAWESSGSPQPLPTSCWGWRRPGRENSIEWRPLTSNDSQFYTQGRMWQVGILFISYLITLLE